LAAPSTVYAQFPYLGQITARDVEMVNLLIREPTVSLKALGLKLGITKQAVAERKKKLEDGGFIMHYLYWNVTPRFECTKRVCIPVSDVKQLDTIVTILDEYDPVSVVYRTNPEAYYVGTASSLTGTIDEVEAILLIDDDAGDTPLRAQQQCAELTAWFNTAIENLDDFGQVIVIGIASSPDAIEPPLQHRFDHAIAVYLPDRRGRIEILQLLTAAMPLTDDVDLEQLAELTPNYSGIQLKQLCQTAAARTLRRTLQHIAITDAAIPRDVLHIIKVRMDDFRDALHVDNPNRVKTSTR
jgi:hypothetical protein